ncbi:MAG: cytidine deaminase [Rhodospirillaceae bacterium]|mgnify:CR=1 FL=1|jgi:cytidine deaminase|nr:cytidine deaminase [Rhodospirillaceae bacterium]MBT5192468.1 cytidine deaminase [Rhodospirillaceae bacterium]MBT5897905.1 cytidine deaminase [Rhodospirillaceae bacterium]MBT6429196.1 cytidine deaminase [Rhodospirillaceae bacterium]MBT7760427.1 cytidine deaminase [Rhodospirillaceae bacterium]
MDDLLQVACVARERAHAPYSRFKVGAAVRDASGGVHGGCNIENAAYPEGICAETAAIAAMVMAGADKIVEVLVVGVSDDPVTPCGGCRQRIREFAGPDVPVHIAAPDGVRMTMTLEELLPRSFGPDNLS